MIVAPFLKSKPLLCRDLTTSYVQLRRNYFSPTHNYGGQVSEDEEIELNYTKNDNHSLEDIEQGNDTQFSDSTSPLWYRVLTQVKIDIDTIKKFMEQLTSMHKQHCTFTVKKTSNFSEEEREIEILTEDIKRLFTRCKQYVERIELTDKPTSQEDVIKKNLKMSLVTELNDLSKRFREQQQDYLQRLKSLKQRKQNVMVYKSEEINHSNLEEELTEEEQERINMLEQKQFDPGFTDEQIQLLIQNEIENIRRDKEIREILASIVELNQLFKELNQLVIEQGTLIDRIDHNIEQTHVFVQKGNKELLQGEKYQKCGTMGIIIVILLVAVLLVIVAIILKVVISLAIPF
ncbi:hypothetical protein ABK040_011995 [Willaertia magna]